MDDALVPIYVLLKRLFIVVSFLILAPASIVAAQEAAQLMVIMPQVRPPFDRVFTEIFNGIENETNIPVERITISDTTTSNEIQATLESKPISAVIALGNQAKNLLQPLQLQQRIIYGAAFLNPTEEARHAEGISLTPSPRETLKWLNVIAPEIKTVHVVYHEQYNGWLIDLAEEVAPSLSLAIKRYPAIDVREAATQFRDIFETANPETDSLWLMQRDPSLDEKAVVPDILAQAWNKDFIIFSSNPSHVPRGALFALYPDNIAMGESLARLALTPKQPGQSITPLDSLLIAVNIRTASHVGRSFARSEEKQFDLIFPNR